MLFSNLFYIPLLLPLVASFAVEAPSQATVGRSTEFKWIRHNGDTSSFSLLLRRNEQDRGGVIIETIRSTSASQGTSRFTTDRATNYLIEVISDLTALADNQQPQQILATSSTITSVQDTNPVPPPPPQNTPTSPNNPQQPTQRPQDTTTSPISSSTTTAPPPRNGDSNNNAGGGQQTNPQTQAQTQAQATATGGSGNSGPGQGTGSGSGSSSRAAATGTATETGSGGSNTSLPPSNFSTNSGLPPPGNGGIPSTSTPSSGTVSGPTPTDSSTPDPPLAGGTSKKNNLGIILGAVFGTLLFILLVLCLLFAWNRRRRRQSTREFAFRRDLMVQRPLSDTEEQRSNQSRVSFWPVERSYNSTDFTGSSSTRETTMSTSDSFTEGLEAYQSYWNSHPIGGPDSLKSQSLHVPAASTSNHSTLSDSTNASSSPSIFYTAVPQALQPSGAKPPQPPQSLYQSPMTVPSPARQSLLYQTQQPLYQTSTQQQPLFQTQRLAPGFIFPPRSARPASTAFVTLIPTSPPGLTDRQAAIQNKVVQLRAQMTRLQSENARGSGTTDRSTYSDDGGKVQNREEIQRIREEIERLEEIMKSSWARRNESASELPAGLRS